MKYKVLSTKKLESSLVDQAGKNDIEIIEQEFISINPIFSKKDLKRMIELSEDEIQYVVFTSSNAVTSITNVLKKNNLQFRDKWKIFCLSGKTKEIIIDHDFPEKNIVSVADNATTLAKKIVEQKINEVIFFCGNQRRDELPEILKNAGIKVHEIIVYKTIEIPKEIRDEFDAILFFSPSAVKSFFQNNKLNEQTILFVIGETTAKEIKDHSKNKIVVSDNPQIKILLEKVIHHFQAHPIHY